MSATGPGGQSHGASYQKSRTNKGDGTVSKQGSVQNQQGETVLSGSSTTARSYNPETKTATTDKTRSVTGKNGNTVSYDYDRTSTYNKETHTVETQSSLTVTGENGKSATATGQRSTTYGQGARDSQGTYTGRKGQQATTEAHTTWKKQDGAVVRETDATVKGPKGGSGGFTGTTTTTAANGVVTKQQHVQTKPRTKPSPAPSPSPQP